MSDNSSQEPLLSLEEAQRFLDTSKSTLYRLLSIGDLKGVRVGKQWRFRKSDLADYLERGPVLLAMDASASADAASELDWFEAQLEAFGRPPASDTSGVDGSIRSILRLAVSMKASDLHLEPASASFRMRCRIDGVLHEIRNLPIRLHAPLIARLKEMSGMNVAERRCRRTVA